MLPERLKKQRKRMKLNQEDMADRLGITRQGYGHYETGRNEPDNETLFKLSNILNCSTDYLLGRVDDPDLYSSREEVERAIRKKGLMFDGKDLSQLSEKDRKFIEEMVERLLNED